MGMSATQARLIQLTARMSDTEYEAQQINQQRLTLSNKMNEVYEMMCNMIVPTPPSKIDYMHPVYRGKQGGTDYQASINDDGSVGLKIKATGDVVQNAGNKQLTTNNDPSQYLETKSYTAEDFKTYDIKDDYVEVVTEDDGVTTQWSDWSNDDIEYVTGSYKLTQTISVTNMSEEEYNKLDDSDSSVSYNKGNLTPTTTGEGDEKVTTYSGSYERTETFEVSTPTDRKTVEEAAKDQYPDAKDVTYDDTNLKTHHCEGTRKVSSFTDGKNYVSTKGGDAVTGEQANAQNKTAAENKSKTFVVASGDGYKTVGWEEIAKGGVEAFACTNVTAFMSAIEAQKSGSGALVGGSPTMSIEQAMSTYKSNQAWEDALSGLQNTFPDNDQWKDFSVIVTTDGDGKQSFSFCMTSDLNESGNTDKMVTVYTPAKGSYWQPTGDVDPNDVTWDSNGNIASVKGVSMETEMVVDEYAYDAALNKYSSDKAIYDKEQNELNKKTSIYQRQDKQLELKLTRLDSERNALNTEIEAVKKVIQDAIDRGFKTFSG